MKGHRLNTDINRSILKLALPAILTNVATPLMSMVDTAVVGHLGDTVYLAAIAVGGSIFNMLYWVLNFLRTGTSGLTAQARGRGDTSAVATLLLQAMFIALAASVLLLTLQTLVCRGMILFLSPEPETAVCADIYFSAAIWGAPAVLGTYALSGWFIGNQDTRPILLMAVISNLVNIALNLTMVYVLGMGVTGVGFATAVSQWIGLVIGLIYMVGLNRRLSLKYYPRDIFKPHARIGRFFKLNFDIFLRTLCLVAVTLWFTRSGAVLGDTTLAANAVLMQLFMLFSFFMDGFAYAGEALSGLYYGAGNKRLLYSTIKALLTWGVILSIVGSALYFIFGEAIFTILTDRADVIATALDYRLWIVAVPLCGFMAFIWDGVFIGLTLTRYMLLSMAIATAIYFGVYFIATPTMGNHGLWLAFTAYLATRGLAQHLIYRYTAI
ncbi:MAG: MATE family efflux transporter [Muribaculaceae bacterium]|nr:MATE family efflux transporter [Muribaculaceae bacterium]